MGTPIPSKENESRSAGHGPVITYTLSKEELDKIISQPIPRGHHRPMDLRIKKKEEYPVQNTAKTTRKDGPACGLTKRALLEAIAAGETLSSVERAWSMKYNTIHTWVKAWGVKGITPGKAREMLAEMGSEQAEASTPVAPVAQEISSPAVNNPNDMGAAKRAELRFEAEVKRWQAVAEQAADMANKHLTKNKELIAERDALRAELQAARTNAEPSEQLEAPVVVAVNHPAHYTAGKIECIDAIGVATTGLTGSEAYNTGAALDNLWHWKRKNGVEDLKKARWHIDRLIGAVGNEQT